MNILIINKNKIIIDILDNLIRKCFEPKKTLKAYTIKHAKIQLSNSNVDIVYLDMSIESQFDGVQLFKEIKKNNPGLPIIAITSPSNVKVVSTLLDLEPHEYLIKPLSLAQIERSILTTSNI